MMLKKLFLSSIKVFTITYLLIIVITWGVSDALIFLPPKPGYNFSDDLFTITSHSVKNNKTHNIIAEYKKNPAANYTILYSHGNAVDLSGLKDLQRKFLRHNFSVIMYDYSGYGLSSGHPTEQQVYNDSQAVYNYLVEKEKLAPEKIIIYGHSLGSAVAANLALHNPSALLVLESPFTSAFRVKTIYPIVPFDKFSTIDKISNINTPLFITHSYDDSVIAISHSKTLFKMANQPKQNIWFNNAGHNNITHQGEAFWLPFQHFIKQLPLFSDTKIRKNST